MTPTAAAFDHWIRTGFVAINTALEELYFAQPDRGNVDGVGDDLKRRLHDEGMVHVEALAAEGNTGGGFDSAFDVLGNVGLLVAALRRHELTNPAREAKSPFAAASSLALQAGASIGMVPRFATAHLTTRNRAVAGVRKSFTRLPDEFLFIDENCRAILMMSQAADALYRILPLGITNPVADVLLEAAAAALRDVVAINDRLARTLDEDRFFFSVRPYYRPYRVGRQEYRGANGGDFSGINEIDLLLGLTSGRDPAYAALVAEKLPYMPPQDQQRLRDCLAEVSLLDRLIAAWRDTPDAATLPRNTRLFLAVCEAFAETARQHHDLFVTRFIAGPAARLSSDQYGQVTSSGPPLAPLMTALAALRDLRMATGRGSRADDLCWLAAQAASTR